MFPHGRFSHGLSVLSAPPMPVEYWGHVARGQVDSSVMCCPKVMSGVAM